LSHIFDIFVTMNKFTSIIFIFTVYTISQVFTFYQLQGHLWNKWIKENPLLMTLFGIPIGYFVILASRQMVHLYDGQTWPNRIIGFVLGVFVFSFMSWIMLKEPITTKTIVCLILSFAVLCIQLFWK
jgi:hypothetical protein